MKLLGKVVVAGLLIGMAGYPSSAEDAGYMKLENLLFMDLPINVASTKAETVMKTVSTVSLIDQNTIRDYNFQTVSEAVSTIAGFDSIRTSFMNTIPMSRGILQAHYANKTLVLVNGVASWFTVTGEGFINRININDVERIEVLKGPASVLYGSNAYSGVVNIVLKEQKNEGSSVMFHGAVGSAEVVNGGGIYTSRKDGVVLTVAANASTELGVQIKHIDTSGEVGYVNDLRYPKGGNYSLVAKYKEHSMLFNGYKDEFLGLEGNSATYATGAGKPHSRAGYLANYKFLKPFMSDKAQLIYTLTYDWNKRQFSRQSNDSEFSLTTGYRANSSLQANIDLTDTIHAEAGVDYEYRHADFYKTYNPHTDVTTSFNNIKDQHSYEWAGLGQLGYKINKFNMLLGTRLTTNEFFGTNNSSRGTLVYALNEKNSIKVIAGQSFRAPAIFELYFLSATRTTSGNKKLLPETSDSVEVAYLTSVGKTFLQATAYQAHYQNKIYRKTYPNGVLLDDGLVSAQNCNKYENGDAFVANGIEVEMKYANPDLIDAFLNAGLTTSDETGEVGNFKYVPDYIASAGLSKKIGNFFVSGLAKYRWQSDGRWAVNSAYPEGVIPSSVVGDINIGYTTDGNKVRHSILVQNVTDVAVFYSEYARQTGTYMNAIPSPDTRRIIYTVSVKF